MGQDFEGTFSPDLSENLLWERMLAVFADRLHVTSAMYGFLPSVHWLELGGISQVSVIRHNHPDDIIGQVNGKGMLDDDPCALRLRAEEPWFLWADALDWAGVDAEQKARFDSGDPGGNVGVTIRLPFFEGRALAGLGLCARATSPEAFREAWLAGLDDHLALARAFDAAMRPRMIANRFKLSKREVSVIRLLATGLSAKRAADFLGLQPKTVFNVMDKARKSLQAETTLQAVTKAMAYRLI
ncbi:MAG: autoinducer binding domain-containing protein [Rhizobiales bacterium]|nr:autoinducer binding domain-containing protein [Hyphomicrobiales bacterium]